MFTRFKQILKLFLSPLLSTFKLYNTQPNLQQKSAMVWQGFMLQVRLQRFFCKSERKFNFCPPFLCKNVKNWNCICKWDFFLKPDTIWFFGSNCAFIFLLIKWWPEKNYTYLNFHSFRRTPPRTPRISGLKSQVSKPTFFSKK